MNEKIAVLTNAGLLNGRITWTKTEYGPQPSMRAASSRSRGRPRMNWTIGNTKNASVASIFGTISGSGVLIQPKCLNSTYCGTISTWCGSNRVPIMMANQKRRNGKRKRANAYAVTRQEAMLATTTPSAITVLLAKNRPKLDADKPRQP